MTLASRPPFAPNAWISDPPFTFFLFSAVLDLRVRRVSPRLKFFHVGDPSLFFCLSFHWCYCLLSVSCPQRFLSGCASGSPASDELVFLLPPLPHR